MRSKDKAGKNQPDAEDDGAITWNMFDGISVTFNSDKRDQGEKSNRISGKREEPDYVERRRRGFGGESQKQTGSAAGEIEARQSQESNQGNWWVSSFGSDDSKRDSPVPQAVQSRDDPRDMKQRRAVYRSFGGVPSEYIRIEESEPVQPQGADHVVVKILASTVTLQDCLLHRGLDFQVTDPVSLPAVPGHDFVGLIVACGDKVQTFSIGGFVAGLVRTGGNARFISVSEKSLVEVPQKLDPAEAVCMVSVYATAYQCLKCVSTKHPVFSLGGQKVLIIGGMDAVGRALCELSAKAHAEVYTTAPEKRHSFVRSKLGAKPLSEAEWSRSVDHEMDLVFDGICQDGLSESLSAVAENGTVVCYGGVYLLKQKMGLFGAPLSAHVERLKMEYSGKAKVLDLWESYKQDSDNYKKNLHALFQLLKDRKVRPHITKRIGLGEVGLAHHKLETGQLRGTIVCLPWKRISKQSVFRVSEQAKEYSCY